MTREEMLEILRDESNCNVLDYVDDAADMLEADEKRIAELETTISEMEKVDKKPAWENGALLAQMPKWISVDDRLPSEQTTVIVYEYDLQCVMCAWMEDGDWTNGDMLLTVTRWMPLPHPQKEE